MLAQYQVTEARHRHAVWRVLQDVCVSNDEFRAVGRHGFLESADVHDADARGETVHWRSRRDCKAGQPETEAGVSGHIRDGTGADPDHEIRITRDTHDDLSQRGLIKAGVLQHMGIRLDSRSDQRFGTALPGNLPCDLITENIGSAVRKTLYIRWQGIEHAGADLHRTDRHIVPPSAVTVQLDAEILLQGLRLLIHFQYLFLQKT